MAWDRKKNGDVTDRKKPMMKEEYIFMSQLERKSVSFTSAGTQAFPTFQSVLIAMVSRQENPGANPSDLS